MLLIVFGRIVQILLMFATIKVSTTLLPPAEMARVFLVTSIVAFYALMLLNPVGMFMNRRLHVWNDTGRVHYYYRFFWAYLLIVCGVAIASLEILFKAGWINISASTDSVVSLVGGSLLFSTVNQVVIPGLNLLGYRRWFIALTLATAIMSLGIALLAVIQFGAKAENWIWGLLIGQLVVAIVGWKVFFSKAHKCDTPLKITKQNVNTLIHFAWPVSIAVGLSWAQAQGYRFMMGSSLGLSTLGLFAAGYGVSVGLISAFESVFTAYLQPMFYKQVSGDNEVEQSKAFGQYSAAIFPSLMLFGLTIFAIAPEITRVMLGAEYWVSAQFVGWGVAAEMARVTSAVYGMIAYTRMNTKILLAPSLAGASLSLALLMWLIPLYGSHGAGMALMISALVACILTYVLTHNQLITTFPRKMVLISLWMGGGVLLLAKILRKILGKDESLMMTLAQLSLISVVFIVFQYILLRPLLFRNQRYDVSVANP